MKLSQSFFNENTYYITPSDMIEFNYCKRFIYYMKVLGINQYEGKRYKVMKGREIHDKKERENRDYLRKKLGVVDKKINVSLVSDQYKMRGKVDEILTLSDHTMAPLDYKFAKYEDKIYNTYKTQMIMYALMIREVYDVDVNKGFLVYCRGGNTIKEVEISRKDIAKLEKDLKEYANVLDGYYPKATSTKRRCIDCTYRNICIR